MKALSVAALLVAFTVSVSGQTLRFNPITGNYTLTFTDDLGAVHVVDVETFNRVNPRVEARIVGNASPWRYIYDLEHLVSPGPQTPIHSFYVRCAYPDPPQVVSGGGFNWRAGTSDLDGRRRCRVIALDELEPGAQADSMLIVQSGQLPAIDTAYTRGVAERTPFLWETVPDTVLRILHGIWGFEGSHKMLVPTPLRPPFSSGVGQALATIGADVTQACNLGWTSSSTVCDRLQAQLTATWSAASAGNYARARGTLGAFIGEIAARHGDASPTVDANAFALHNINARYVRSNLFPAPACGDTTTLRFLANLTNDAGEVRVWNDAQNLFVRYSLGNEWSMQASKLAVATSLSGIPRNENGQPVLQDFPYQTTHSRVTSYTYTVSLSSVGAAAGSEVLVAPYGDVFRNGITVGWPEGTRFSLIGTGWGAFLTHTVTSCQ